MKFRKKITTLLILILLCSVTLLSSFARYSSDYVWNYYLESREFYMRSDYLGNDKKNTNTQWNGSSVHFNVKNFSNNNLITDNDISYTITCEILNNDPYTCKINGTNSSTLSQTLRSDTSCINTTDDGVNVSTYTKTECIRGNYTWRVNPVVNDIYFTLTNQNQGSINKANVKITIRSTSPYKKTLTGIFNLVRSEMPTEGIIRQINDNTLYDELIITNTYSVKKCVLVSFNPSTRIVDSNTSGLSNITTNNDGYINSFKVEINQKDSKKIKFYNRNLSVNYSSDDFVITESTGCV